MEEKSTATLEKIQQAAMEEFSEKGFQGASLRPVSPPVHFTVIFPAKRRSLHPSWSPTPLR